MEHGQKAIEEIEPIRISLRAINHERTTNLRSQFPFAMPISNIAKHLAWLLLQSESTLVPWTLFRPHHVPRRLENGWRLANAEFIRNPGKPK